MQKRYLTVLLALAVLLGLLGGCRQAAEEQDTPPEHAAEPQIETPEAAETDPNALTAAEIEQVNEVFTPTFERDGWLYANPLCSFFTSYYERPEDLDLAEFLRYFFEGSSWEKTEEEMKALSQAEGWPFGDRDPETLPVPVHKYLRGEVDVFLMAHAGITTADLTNINTGTADLMYLPEYDAFYNLTSDFSPGFFICNSGRRDGDRVILTGDLAELVLEQQPDGNWYFVSHLPLEQEP